MRSRSKAKMREAESEYLNTNNPTEEEEYVPPKPVMF